jgi:hypothetical protein
MLSGRIWLLISIFSIGTPGRSCHLVIRSCPVLLISCQPSTSFPVSSRSCLVCAGARSTPEFHQSWCHQYSPSFLSLPDHTFGPLFAPDHRRLPHPLMTILLRVIVVRPLAVFPRPPCPSNTSPLTPNNHHPPPHNHHTTPSHPPPYPHPHSYPASKSLYPVMVPPSPLPPHLLHPPPPLPSFPV